MAARSVGIVGAGLIGTSIGLALSRQGVDVVLADRDQERARIAGALGAGRAWTRDDVPRHVVLAVPPGAVAAELRRRQRTTPGAVFTDTASVKRRPQEEAAQLGCDLDSFCGGHPIAGRELSGPTAASADLFRDRPWVLTPAGATSTRARDEAAWVATACGARPVVMDPSDHDVALGLVSHVPQLLSSLLAARMVDLPDDVLRLAGTGLHDTTRLAGSDPALWDDIVRANAEIILDVVQALAGDLEDLRLALAADHGERILALLRAGNDGRTRLLRSRAGAEPVPT